ncbi:calmodulin-binding protein [Wolffia australiana]
MQRHNRHQERPGAMMRGKRELEQVDTEERQQEGKRPRIPALASVIVEALKVDSLQKLCSSLEPILRRVVSEEVERALAKLGPPRVNGRVSPKRIEGPDGRNLQLHFRTRLAVPLFTGGKVEGDQGAAIHVVLLDANTGHVVTSGSESSAKLDIVVLEGDFNNEGDNDWTEEDFESHVVKERDGKRPLLTGDLQVTLKEGVGTIGDLTFTDNSSWIRSRKFRLGLKIASGFCEGIRIREAKTEAFIVKDHRGELYKKHYPPALKDEVWRLEKIGKDGSFHKRLNKHGIYTVEDFLRFVVRDPQKLRSILGTGMSNKMWESLVEHSKTCVLSGKLYVYYSDDSRNVGVVFNNIYELTGLIANGQYHSAESLPDTQKIFVDSLVKKAYERWMDVIEYDGKALLNAKKGKRVPASRLAEPLMAPSLNYPSYDQQLPYGAPVPPQLSLLEPSLGVGGAYSEDELRGYGDHLNHHASQSPVDSGDFSSQSQHLVPSSSHLCSTGSSVVYDDWSRRSGAGPEDVFPSEDEIRLRSHEMLENEDMQNLLRVFTMGGGGSSTLPDGGGFFSSFMQSPLPGFGFVRTAVGSSGKAVVGWLKIKAAMRWGIFIRKKAAERRAQLVELED